MWALGDKSAQETSDSDNFTFLGKGVDFKGILNFDGTIRIDGRVEGEVHTTGTLIIGEQAVIKGILSAGTLMTSGKVNGTVTATAKNSNPEAWDTHRRHSYTGHFNRRWRTLPWHV